MVLERGILLNNRYRIVEILGQGGMGSVYRAIDENLGLEVAVKDNFFTTEEYSRQFKREALILAGMRHPNLPRVTDHLVIPGQGQYLVMDFIEGEDLRQRMEREGVLSEEDVITIGAAMCDALGYMASRTPPVVHRDIKPGNVKITPQGQIYLVDFGLAKTIEGSQETTTGARAMTPGYSPPEQYGTARTDNRSDIYSLGATLYAALTGTPPEDALARAMDQVKLTPIRQHNPKVSRRLAQAMEKALELYQEDRYQDAAEFKQALLSAGAASRRLVNQYVIAPPPSAGDEIEQSRKGKIDQNLSTIPSGRISTEGKPSESYAIAPVSVNRQNVDPKTPTSRPDLRRRKKKNKLAQVIFGIFSILGLVAFINFSFPQQVNYIMSSLMLGRYIEGSTIKNTTDPQIVFIDLTPTATEIITIEVPTFTPQPTETKIPVVMAVPSTETPIPTISPTPLPTTTGGGGGKIAYASDSSGIPQIYYVQVNSGITTKVTDMPEGACQPDWSNDGKRLVFVSPCDINKDYYPGSSLYIVNLDGTGLLPLPTVSGGDFDPAWSPDGTKIAFTSLRNNGRIQIHVIDLSDNSVIQLSDKYSFDMQPAWSRDGKRIVFVSTRRGSSQIWTMDADGGNQQPFSHSNAFKNYIPSWAPDNSSIIFTQYVAEGGIPRAVLSPLGVENYVEYKVGIDAIPMRGAVFSPDGYWIAYEGWLAGTSHDIYIIAASGAGKQQLTTDPRIDFDPAWCPSQ